MFHINMEEPFYELTDDKTLIKNTPQFKVGDEVKILPRDDSQKYCPIYTDGMLQYAGRLATITDIDGQSCQIDLDRGAYFWPLKALQLVLSFRNSIQRINTVTNLPSGTKEEPQIETELNLFPKKKHYQLNFNY